MDGGNVAIDIARTIKKLGAAEVCLVYRRSKKEMPAERTEIEEAEKDGVKMLFQTNVIKIIENNVGADCIRPGARIAPLQIECVKTELVKKAGEEREIPIDIEGSNFYIETDYVMMAVGSKLDKNIAKKEGLELTAKGYVKINSIYMTNIKGVFAGGDFIGTKATVAWAAKTGKDAAIYMNEYVRNLKKTKLL